MNEEDKTKAFVGLWQQLPPDVVEESVRMLKARMARSPEERQAAYLDAMKRGLKLLRESSETNNPTYMNSIHWKDRITPNNITQLQVGEVFTYGDNEAHKHGMGAAKFAMKFGAKYHQGGLVGSTYGIPTKDKQMRVLPIDKIKLHVDKFMEVAILNPDLTFLVTEIGCGLAGYKPKDIAPLFADALYLENIHLPERFWRILIK